MHCIKFLLVPSAPVSVQVGRISGQPNQLSIVWQTPTTPNGMVISYTAYCFESSEDEVYGSGYLGEADRMPSSLMYPLENITSNVTVPGSESSAAVGGLDPYKRYACFVTASTSVGEGEPSFAASAVTDESSKLTNSHLVLCSSLCYLQYLQVLPLTWLLI